MSIQPAPALIDATCIDLAQHAPFDAMDRRILRFIAERLSLRYFAKNERILSAGDDGSRHLFIVQKGSVHGQTPKSRVATLTLTEGECFPVGALIGQRATALDFVAATDTFCYVLQAADFEHVMDVSREFRHFATRRLAALLEQSTKRVQQQFNDRVSDSATMVSSLASIIRRDPVSVRSSETLRNVLEKMTALHIGSVAIVDENNRPVGIFTERDVVGRVALAGLSLDRPVADAMTPRPFSLPGSAPVFEAARAMALHRFRHVLVVDGERLVGVVSERDLFTLQRFSVGEIAKAIEYATDIAALSHAARSVRGLAGALLAQGMGAEQLTQLVTTLNDAVVERCLAIAAQEVPPAQTAWCWLGLGSEGRMEQTLSTDQDNAIIFSAAPDQEAAYRAALLAFATRANAHLAACGFPLCKGDIMAKNPKWCLSEREWRHRFESWLSGASPDALMHAAIFFDFRPLSGDASLATSLRRWLNEAIPRYPIFMRLMAANGLVARPPLGLLRDFAIDHDRYPGTIDLKQLGARPFIDAARVYALRQQASSVNTADRLREVAAAIRMPDEERDGIVDSFHFIQLLRLRSQEAIDDDSTMPPNRINPDHLSTIDQRILKEALRQARKLQTRLEMDFSL